VITLNTIKKETHSNKHSRKLVSRRHKKDSQLTQTQNPKNIILSIDGFDTTQLQVLFSA